MVNLTEMTVTEYGYTNEQAGGMSRAGLEQLLDKMAAGLASEEGSRCGSMSQPPFNKGEPVKYVLFIYQGATPSPGSGEEKR